MLFLSPSRCDAADSDHTWKIAHVPMEARQKFRYSFQAVRGDPPTSAGGIYIDDISLTETCCPNAVWRIQNFSKILETANASTVVDSPRFYSPEGYGYGVRMVPLSSYSDYTGNYVGLYFHLLSGENDAVVQWPAVHRQATLVVMDQDPDVKLRMSSARSLTTDMRNSKRDRLDHRSILTINSYILWPTNKDKVSKWFIADLNMFFQCSWSIQTESEETWTIAEFKVSLQNSIQLILFFKAQNCKLQICLRGR